MRINLVQLAFRSKNKIGVLLATSNSEYKYKFENINLYIICSQLASFHAKRYFAVEEYFPRVCCVHTRRKYYRVLPIGSPYRIYHYTISRRNFWRSWFRGKKPSAGITRWVNVSLERTYNQIEGTRKIFRAGKIPPRVNNLLHILVVKLSKRTIFDAFLTVNLDEVWRVYFFTAWKRLNIV